MRAGLKFTGVSPVPILVSFILGLAMAFWLSKGRMSGIPAPNATFERIAGRDSLVVSIPEHPPLSQSSFYCVDFDYEEGYIDIFEIRVLWNLFSQNRYGRPPVIIQCGLLPQTYKVRYWNSERFVPLGILTVDDQNKLTWNKMPDAPDE
ncbi:hypothetical protein [Planctomicrobium sp. SH664]|uniref:hypothetical protein n=1 Tax=Planctomicrobium sp. SH664 TaxID=3448125 RepID=UPI003F5B2FBD